MENKNFMKVPKDKFERLIYSGHLAEGISGNKVIKSQLEKEISKLGIVLTDEQKELVKNEFAIEL